MRKIAEFVEFTTCICRHEAIITPDSVSEKNGRDEGKVGAG